MAHTTGRADGDLGVQDVLAGGGSISLTRRGTGHETNSLTTWFCNGCEIPELFRFILNQEKRHSAEEVLSTGSLTFITSRESEA